MESTKADDLNEALLGDTNYRYEMEGLPRRRRRHRDSGGEPEQVNIWIKMHYGVCIVLLVDLLDTVDSVKAMIENEEGIRFGRQYRLDFGGRTLEDERTLSSYSIQNNSTLLLQRRLRGGDPPEVLRGAGTTEQQQKRCSSYYQKALLFVVTMVAAYKLSASASLTTGKIALSLAIAAVIFADVILSVKKVALRLQLKWCPSACLSLSVPWSIYLSCSILVLASYLLLISYNKVYAYAIFPVPLPIVAAFAHHKYKKRKVRGQSPNDDDEAADQASVVDTELQAPNIEDVLRNDDDSNNTDRAGADRHNSEDDQDVQHFDDIFEFSSSVVNLGALVTMVLGHKMVGPVSALGFFFFFTVVVGLYLMTITTVRTVALTPHATYLEIILKFLLAATLIAAVFSGST